MINVAVASKQVNRRRKKPTNVVNVGINLQPSEEMFVMMIMVYQYGIIPRVTDDGVQIYQVR